MRLLVITQAVDTNNDILGFFHIWLGELSRRCESLTVICLSEGAHDLPKNVRVRSLGKEEGLSKTGLLFRFYKYAWSERANYDAVFVHMTPLYIPLGWPLWRLQGKRIFLWYNHPVGTPLTRIAVWFAETVFYTSPFAFSARFEKANIMPAGIPTELFQRASATTRIPRTILCLGRLSPAKRVECLIEAARILDQRELDFQLRIVGSPARAGDGSYEQRLRGSARVLVEKGKASVSVYR